MNNQLQKIFKNYDSKDRKILADEHCGPGSTMWYTSPLRNNLVNLLDKYSIRSMLDSPCGDFQWMNTIKFPDNFDYLGGDLHESLIQRNRKLYHKKFIILDITEDDLPSKDLIFVRDCLFHLSDELKTKFFKNFLRSNFKYLLTSNHPRHTQNYDIINNMNGHHHENINWSLSPWNFPKSIDTIIDYDETDHRFSSYPYRTMELWTYDQINQAISNI
jgi:SAM-dependent methyltransferase